MEWRILIILKNLLNERKRLIIKHPDENKIFVQDIANLLNADKNEFHTANKSISNRLDKIGLKKYRLKDTNRGSYFEITYEKFKEIVEPASSQLFSG